MLLVAVPGKRRKPVLRAHADGVWELESNSAQFLEPGSRAAAAPAGPVPVYPQRTPLKKGALPKLLPKALAALERAEADDPLPDDLRQRNGFMSWHQVPTPERVCWD